MCNSHIYIEYKINTKSQLSNYLKSENLKKKKDVEMTQYIP